MKNIDLELSTIFSVAEEMKPGNGEDCLYYAANDNSFIIASFDGCGGSGSKKYTSYSEKTGAYVASRAVCGAVKTWFEESKDDQKLPDYILSSLSVCQKYGDKNSRIAGSLGKSFPTTAAILYAVTNENIIKATCMWAGDSRCYILDEEGLHQLTEDDLSDEDAMSNLSSDGVMTNVISASSSFDIHIKKLSIDHPCILFSATDGCFGYLNSPMEFEYLLTETLINSKNIAEWKENLNKCFMEIAGDDYTLCVAACGYKSFDDMRKNMSKRNKYLTKKYIRSDDDINKLWNEYKKDYSIYLK